MIQVDIEVQVFVKILCVECGEIAQWEKATKSVNLSSKLEIHKVEAKN